MNIFDETIVTELPGMAGGTGYNTVEDLYQAFKARIVAELLVDHPDLRSYGELVEAVTQSPVLRTMKREGEPK